MNYGSIDPLNRMGQGYEDAWRVQCLPRKHEELSWDPRQPCSCPSSAFMSMTPVLQVGQHRDPQSLLAKSSVSSRFTEDPVSKDKAESNRRNPHQPLACVHIHTHTCSCMYAQGKCIHTRHILDSGTVMVINLKFYNTQ